MSNLFGRFSVMNGLRGLTLIWVMFVHLPGFAFPEFLMEAHNHWRFGVDFFFAISGFLVTRSLFQCLETQKHKPLVEFLIRRVSRIFPPYYFLLALLGALAFATRGNFLESLRGIKDLLPSFPLFFANYTIGVHSEKIPHPLMILWSVSFQEQFYCLLALFFFLFPKNLSRILLIAGLFSIVSRLVLAFTIWQGQDRAFCYEAWLHLNFDALSWGCLAWIYFDELKVLWSSTTRAWITTLIMAACTAFVISSPSFFPGDKAQVLVACLKAPILALWVRAVCELEHAQALLPSLFKKLLQSKLLGRMGLASYEIYLLHVIVYGFVEKLHLPQTPIYSVIAYPVSVVSGILFYTYFGMPSQDIAKTLLRKTFRVTRTKTLVPA